MSAPFRRRWLLAVGAGTAISLVACGAVETNESPASAVTDPARATAALRSTPIVTTNLPAPRAAPVEATIPLVGTPTLAWADEQYVWIGGLEGYSRIDPDTNEVTATVDAAGAIHVVTGFGSVWTRT